MGFLEISLGFMGTISFGSQWSYEYYTMRHLSDMRLSREPIPIHLHTIPEMTASIVIYY
jgi:hypothetical protein